MAKKEQELKFAEVYKDWRDSGHEIEVLGDRLDKARNALAKCKEGTWAHRYWNLTVERLFKKWRLSVTMKTVGLVQVGRSDKIKIRSDWWEGSEEVGGPAFGFTVIDDWIHGMGLSQRLDESWERAQKEKLQRARQGLA